MPFVTSSSYNIISTKQFSKMRRLKFDFYDFTVGPMRYGKFEFFGKISTTLEINSIKKRVFFFVREGSEDVLILNQETAKIYGVEGTTIKNSN